MGTVIDFASYRENVTKVESGTLGDLAVASSSRNQRLEWKIEKEKINQDHDFINDAAHEVRKHTPDPIKDINDINRILDYFLSRGQYRNLLLFTMGINFGLRCDDLLKLKFGHIMDIDGNIKSEVVLEEEKTSKKENKEKNIKAKRGHIRICYMNDFVVEVAKMYVNSITSSGHTIDLNNFLFTSLSNSNSFKYYDNLRCKPSSTGKPLKIKRDPDSSIQVKSVEKMLKKVINDELGIKLQIATHSMRKTFAYQVITNAPDRSRALELLQRILGHKSSIATLYYAGITGDEIKNVCQNLYHGRIDFCGGIGLGSCNKVGGNM